MKTQIIMTLLLATINCVGCAANEKVVPTDSTATAAQLSQTEPVVSQMTLNGQPIDAMLVNGKGFPFSDVQRLFETFKASPEFPKIETRDFRQTPWGFKGSSSTLSAFYIYLAEQDNHGWHIDPPEYQVPLPVEIKP